MTQNSNGYSRIEEWLHRLAFVSTGFQVDLADVENRFFQARLDAVQAGPPVFVTSLPRAGTTVLLEALAKFDGLASHIYRDMPFLFCPMLWATFSKHFQQQSILRPRAHGDGVLVGYDSAEAFEEAIWRRFWPSHYRDGRIIPWNDGEILADFQAFFEAHMRKIIALRLPVRAGGRYVSKNNVNIARIGLLRRIFPSCAIVVPIRHPVDQAASLQRQHLRALKEHAASPFGRRYVEWLGHYEFGKLLRPIAFPGTEDLSAADGCTLDFWLRYWIATFEHLATENGPIFIRYETFCEQPQRMLKALGERLGCSAPVAAGSGIRAAVTYNRKDQMCSGSLVERADHIYEGIIARALAI